MFKGQLLLIFFSFSHLLCPLHAIFFPPLFLLFLPTFQVTDHTHHHHLDCPFQHHTSFFLIEHHFHHVASGSIFLPWQGYLHHPHHLQRTCPSISHQQLLLNLYFSIGSTHSLCCRYRELSLSLCTTIIIDFRLPLPSSLLPHRLLWPSPLISYLSISRPSTSSARPPQYCCCPRPILRPVLVVAVSSCLLVSALVVLSWTVECVIAARVPSLRPGSSLFVPHRSILLFLA